MTKSSLRHEPAIHWTESSSANVPVPSSGGEPGLRLRLASYNIHIGIGRDGVFSPDRIGEVIAELSADVIALQEVPLGPQPFDMLEHLRQKTGLHALAGPTLVHPANGDYGNALLTSHQVLYSRKLDLSVERCQPRGALDVSLNCRAPGGSMQMRVIATHLGLRPSERRQQVPRLLRAIDERDGDGSTPTALLGDINEWFLWGRPLRWLHAHFRETRALATFPSRWPIFALDRVWVRPARLLSRILVHRSPLASIASDHLPLVADLTVGADGLTPHLEPFLKK